MSDLAAGKSNYEVSSSYPVSDIIHDTRTTHVVGFLEENKVVVRRYLPLELQLDVVTGYGSPECTEGFAYVALGLTSVCIVQAIQCGTKPEAFNGVLQKEESM
jgi:hypothetical protein